MCKQNYANYGDTSVRIEGHSFTCPPDLMANVTLEGWSPTDGGDANPYGDYFGDMPDHDR